MICTRRRSNSGVGTTATRGGTDTRRQDGSEGSALAVRSGLYWDNYDSRWLFHSSQERFGVICTHRQPILSVGTTCSWCQWRCHESRTARMSALAVICITPPLPVIGQSWITPMPHTRAQGMGCFSRTAPRLPNTFIKSYGMWAGDAVLYGRAQPLAGSSLHEPRRRPRGWCGAVPGTTSHPRYPFPSSS